MRSYVIRRLLLIIPTILFVTILVFFSVRLVPGDVVEQMVQEHQFGSVTEKDQTVAVIRAKLGLDLPIHIQYGRWLWGAISRGDIGDSLWKGTAVTHEIIVRLPVTVELGVLAIIVAILLALPIGVYSAIRQDSIGDYIGRGISIGFISVPNFWVGTLIMVFPAIWWGWAPPIDYVPFIENPIENLKMLAIPCLILGMVMSGLSMRMTRTMVLEVLRQDYIRTAWAKGLKERAVVIRHALKNALIPVVTLLGVYLPVIVGGSVVIEQIFCLPGIGRLMLESIGNRDYTIISGVNLMIASFLLLTNLVVDLTYAYLDPRIHYK